MQNKLRESTVITTTDSRFVAHLDILAVKKAMELSVHRAWTMLDETDQILSQLIHAGTLYKNKVKARMLLDTIIAFTVDDTAAALDAILSFANNIFVECLSICVPMRGGISHGDFYYNPEQTLFCGIPFVTAHYLGETSQWMGIIVDDKIVHDSAEKVSVLTKRNPPLMVNWDVSHGNSAIKKQWVINWPEFTRFGKDAFLPMTGKEFYRTFKFENVFGAYESLEPRDRAKYDNTVTFLKKQLEGKELLRI